MDIRCENGVVSIVLGEVSDGWRQEIWLFSDVHFDSVYCDRKSYFDHLEQAVKNNALIIDGGDFFDAMQGRFDPRRSMDELRPEYRRDDYYDFVVGDAAEKLAPYSERIVVMGSGNHELSIRKHASTDLTERLVDRLRQKGAPTVRMGYKGWIRLIVKRASTGFRTVKIRYSHSGGGGKSAPVTRGVIDSNRQAVFLPDADIVWNGHNHQQWIMIVPRERITEKGTVYLDHQYHIRTPGYKNDFIVDNMGFAAQLAKGPGVIGCVCVELIYKRRGLIINPRLVTS